MTALAPTATTTPSVTPSSEVRRHRRASIALGVTRLVMGWTFLWAFIDKLFGFGFATPANKGWLDGGSPTKGFLANSAEGPFEGFYKSIAGDAWANWAFMLGLLGIGLALTLGITMRIAVASGVVLYTMMYTVALPAQNNPVTDDHIIGALVLILLGLFAAGDKYGFGTAWKKLPIVQRFPILR
jgi:thiosulfate dehydrogenase [quinone] large subunit